MDANEDYKLFKRDLCIICQEANKNEHVVSTDNGMKQIEKAANIRQDKVFYRLKLLLPNDTYVYHMNNKCYRNYTNKSNLKKFEKLHTSNDEIDDCESSNASTSNSTERSSKRFDKHLLIDSNSCIICGQISNKKVTKVHELAEERAKILFKVSRFFKDDVFTRTIILDSPEAFMAAKLKYHSTCMRAYERKYERLENVKISDSMNTSVELSNIILESIKSIEPKMYLGEKFSLSDICNLIKEKHGSDFSIKSSKVKSNLIDYFGAKICFIYPKEKNKSQIFFICEEKSVNQNEVITECASILKESLNETKFDLSDKFCDETDLRFAYDNMKIPEPFLLFFSKFFNLKMEDILTNKDVYNDSTATNIQILRIISLFQTIYFLNSKGLKNTPLHVLVGLFVHKTSKSKSIITVLHRLGVSISYDEVLRIRTRLATFATKMSESNVPLPSHFDVRGYVTAAFDNFDHNEATISGLNTTHDTVAVIFQEENSTCIKRKPNISEFLSDKQARCFTNKLKCQEIRDFYKPASTVNLPIDYTVTEKRSLSVTKLENDLLIDDFLWFLSRMNIKNWEEIDLISQNQEIPVWSSFNSVVSSDNRKKQKVGFLPIIPSPVTEYSTVYTSLCNFKSILEQLDQEYLPITCDEAVYKIARHILFQREKEFENLILCLGGFHITKVLHSCIGKYLQNSGVENVLIETGSIGISVVDQILSGNHYSRCVRVFSYLCEALRRLQIKEFFTSERLKKYEHQITRILLLKESFQIENIEECKHILGELKDNSSELLSEFHDFVLSRCNESELFQYWNNFLILVSLMHDLIRADRTGNWFLHLKTIEKLLPIFHIMDRVNYTRWCTIYLEDMLALERKAPEVYREFLKGRFTVKRSIVPFTSVATDQALEQTINRESKSTGGVIGCTKKKETVAIWDITFHEMLSIANYLKEITYLSNNDEEFFSHHELSVTHTQKSELEIQKIIQYLEVKKMNPFMSGCQRLRNITTEELVQPQITKQLLNLFTAGIELYKVLREDRFCKKTKPLSAPISRNNFPNFKSVLASEPSVSKKRKKITTSETQRIIALANERNYPLEELLKYDLTSKNQLFDDDGLIKKESNKSSLIRELEKILENDKVELIKSDTATCLVIDVMLVIRKISWKDMSKFKDLAVNFCKNVMYKASLQNTKRVDLVFDSYFEKSLKSSEHLRRQNSNCIVYHCINEDTDLPKQQDKFWGSSENKILLQEFLRSYMEKQCFDFELIFSTTNNTPCSSTNIDSLHLQILQRNDIEEADLKIMLHINHAAKQGYTNVYVVSSDTDVIVLALYYFKTFQENGLESLWFRVGVSASTRDIPLHVLATRYGEKFCSILPAVHHLTGSDYTSKVGTKQSALQGTPEKYLLEFGKDCSESNIGKSVKLAEEYLVKIFKKGTNCTTFDNLRVWSYYHAKCALIEDLPPTTASVTLHILRAFYIVNLQTTFLTNTKNILDPRMFGWKEEEELLIPLKVDILLPPSSDLIYNCLCKACTRSSCICVSGKIKCCSFCSCQKNNTCKNKYSEQSNIFDESTECDE